MVYLRTPEHRFQDWQKSMRPHVTGIVKNEIADKADQDAEDLNYLVLKQNPKVYWLDDDERHSRNDRKTLYSTRSSKEKRGPDTVPAPPYRLLQIFRNFCKRKFW